MSGFLSQITQKAVERWFTLLVLPGVLFVGLVTITLIMWRNGPVFDPRLAGTQIDRWIARRPDAGAQITVLVGFLLAAAAAGLIAQGVGHLVELLWFSPGSGRLGRRLTARRNARWTKADSAYEAALITRYRDGGRSSADPEGALEARNRICLVPPARPTWMADRARAAGERVYHVYGLDPVSLWPRLWLTVPDTVRTELASARTALSGDARLFAWGLFYLIPALWWWPAALIALSTCAIAWYRARASTNLLADLAESAVDLHARDVGEQLGFPASGKLTPEVGAEIKILLRKE